MDDPKVAKAVDKKVDKLLDKVETVLESQKELVQKQNVILDKVKEDTTETEKVDIDIKEVEKVSDVQKSLINHAKHHKLIFPLVIMAAVVLVWRGLSGIFDVTPVISYSFISLALGLIILWIFNRMNIF